MHKSGCLPPPLPPWQVGSDCAGVHTKKFYNLIAGNHNFSFFNEPVLLVVDLFKRFIFFCSNLNISSTVLTSTEWMKLQWITEKNIHMDTFDLIKIKPCKPTLPISTKSSSFTDKRDWWRHYLTVETRKKIVRKRNHVKRLRRMMQFLELDLHRTCILLQFLSFHKFKLYSRKPTQPVFSTHARIALKLLRSAFHD